ncbi:MAG: porin [Rubripirellula sp.]
MRFCVFLILTFLILVGGTVSSVGHATESAEFDQLRAQLAEQSAVVRQLEQRISQQEGLFGGAPALDSASCTPESVLRLPLVCEETLVESCDGSLSEQSFKKLDFYTDYDKGISVLPFDAKQNPFSMKVNGWIQFRHHAFSRDVTEWTDNAGVTRGVRSRNAFDVERGRLVFSGMAIDERLTYFLQLDGDTDGSHAVDFFDYWWGWKFSKRFRIQMGRRKVTASRQWLLTARRTRFIDRPMVNDFFRPDRTVGIYGFGSFGETGKYELTVGNTHGANVPNSRSDDQLVFAANSYFDPLGDYGKSIVDEAIDAKPRVRLGHSFVYAPQRGNERGVPLDETNFLRLSDGTRVNQVGALAPGVTVSDFDIYMYGVDVATKWNGWSFNGEYFARWIEQIAGDGVLANNEIFQHGHYAEGGYFLVANTLDVNARYSQVSGDFGTSSEVAVGFNWYPLAKHTMKLSFDVTSLDGSPLQNTATDILVGDDGTLFRTQFQTEF